MNNSQSLHIYGLERDILKVVLLQKDEWTSTNYIADQTKISWATARLYLDQLHKKKYVQKFYAKEIIKNDKRVLWRINSSIPKPKKPVSVAKVPKLLQKGGAI